MENILTMAYAYGPTYIITRSCVPCNVSKATISEIVIFR